MAHYGRKVSYEIETVGLYLDSNDVNGRKHIRLDGTYGVEADLL